MKQKDSEEDKEYKEIVRVDNKISDKEIFEDAPTTRSKKRTKMTPLHRQILQNHSQNAYCEKKEPVPEPVNNSKIIQYRSQNHLKLKIFIRKERIENKEFSRAYLIKIMTIILIKDITIITPLNIVCQCKCQCIDQCTETEK